MPYGYDYSDKVIKFVQPDTIDHLDTRTTADPNNPNALDTDGYYVTELIGHALVVDGPVVTYRLNSDGFRTKHFDKFDDSKTKILFSGCSWTFGEGLPEEYIWPELVVKKFIDDGHDVDHYNIGFMGNSINQIINNVHGFIFKYGKPDYVMLALPDFARNIIYSPKQKEFIKGYPNTNFIGSSDKDRERYTLNYQHENNFQLAVTLIRNFEYYCEEAGIKLIWTAWDTRDYTDYNNHCKFKYLMDPDIDFWQCNPSYKKSDKPYYPNPQNLPYWEEARDGAHPGTAWTHFISDKFYSKVKEMSA